MDLEHFKVSGGLVFVAHPLWVKIGFKTGDKLGVTTWVKVGVQTGDKLESTKETKRESMGC